MIPAELAIPPFAPRYFDRVEEFMDVYGYAAPVWVSDPESEYNAVRGAAGAIDFSMLYKFDLTGPGALELVDSVVTRDVASLAPDRIAYGAIVDSSGRMVDDCTVSILASEIVRVVGGNPADGAVLTAAADGTEVEVKARREELAHLCVQGPRSREILAALTDEGVSNEAFPYYTHRDITVAGIAAHVNRMGFTAELGYELFVPRERALELWDAVFEAGEPLGLMPFGGAALMMLRIEAGMVMGDGLEYDSTVSPFECGLGWAVDFGKQNLRAREALTDLRESAPTRLVSLVMERGGDAATGARLSHRGVDVGHITMSVLSPLLGGRTLGLARVATPQGITGTRLIATVGDEEIEAEVVPTPVFDPERTHVRS